MVGRVRILLGWIRKRTLAHPLVYERIRPWILGYHDESKLYEELGVDAHDVVLDIGCGRGMALTYLGTFKEYHGFDVDPTVLARHRKLFRHSNVTCHLGAVREADIASLRPTKVIMIGLLHHLDDEEVLSLLEMLSVAPSVERMITLDPVYVASARFNNLLCRYDSGDYVRPEDELVRLVLASGVSISSRWHSRSGNGLAHYLQMVLTRPSIE